MKVVILAGGFGTRLSEETDLKPKPMIEVGEQPLLMHIMRNFAAQGFNEFIICLGYKGYVIKEYFANLQYHLNNMHIDFSKDDPYLGGKNSINWKIDLVDTGQDTMTGGRLKRIKEYLDEGPFIMTYGDGVADIDLLDLINFHKSKKRLATVTAVRPPARFGVLDIDSDGQVATFKEKFDQDMGWINGGFFVLEQEIFDTIAGDSSTWENEPLIDLSKRGELVAFRHEGFWKPCDTLREKRELEQLWKEGAPWKNW